MDSGGFLSECFAGKWNWFPTWVLGKEEEGGIDCMYFTGSFGEIHVVVVVVILTVPLDLRLCAFLNYRMCLSLL